MHTNMINNKKYIGITKNLQRKDGDVKGMGIKNPNQFFGMLYRSMVGIILNMKSCLIIFRKRKHKKKRLSLLQNTKLTVDDMILLNMDII